MGATQECEKSVLIDQRSYHGSVVSLYLMTRAAAREKSESQTRMLLSTTARSCFLMALVPTGYQHCICLVASQLTSGLTDPHQSSPIQR
jgi:hypothetical protein